jgi:hypothetical protein
MEIFLEAAKKATRNGKEMFINDLKEGVFVLIKI